MAAMPGRPMLLLPFVLLLLIEAQQLVDFQGSVGDGIEVVYGGGRLAFLPNTTKDPEHVNSTGERYDGRNLVQEWTEKQPDSKYIWNKKQMAELGNAKHVLGLFESSNMQYDAHREADVGGEPSITEMVESAIKILKNNNKGFFLMVEEETLIIVTADHGHTMTMAGYPERGNPILGLAKDGGKLLLSANDKLPFTTLGYMNGPSAFFGKRKNLTSTDTLSAKFQQQSLYNGNDEYESHGGQDV
ncbi:predicted protein, partial [Nematostella vectensis]